MIIQYTVNFLISLILVMGQEEEVVPIEVKACRERDRLVTSDKEDLYALVDILLHETLILKCRFCNEEYTDQPKNWYKIKTLGVSKPQEVKLDMNNDPNENRISVNFKHSLKILNFSMEDSGFYYCVHFEDKTNNEKINYLVDVNVPEASESIEKGSITDWSKYHDDNFASINNLFKTSTAPQFVYLRDILKVDAELTTQWAPWGPCEACGRPQGNGVMKRKGFCRIKLSPYGGQQQPNVTSEETYLLKAPAISCRSIKLLKSFPEISSYTRKLPDFILEDRCSGACNPDNQGLNSGWKVGKGKGFKYRKHQVMQENDHITFVCPESSLDNKVAWKKNGKILTRGDGSYRHVLVDTFNTLYLVEVTKEDAGNYTCYVDDIRMQQIVIFVYSKSKILTHELLRYLIYLGFILFLSSFCYCGGLAVTWQRRHLFKDYEELKAEEELMKTSRSEAEDLI